MIYVKQTKYDNASRVVVVFSFLLYMCSLSKIAENLLKSGRSIKFTRSISFTQGEHHQLSIKTKNIKVF